MVQGIGADCKFVLVSSGSKGVLRWVRVVIVVIIIIIIIIIIMIIMQLTISIPA